MKLTKKQTCTLSNKRKIIIQGNEYDSLGGAAKAFGKSRNIVDYRLSKGWSPEQAVSLEPPPSFASKTSGISIQVEGNEFKTLKEAAKHYKRAYTHVIESLKKGRSVEQALGLALNENTLQLKNPNIAKQWHPTKNKSLTSKDVMAGGATKVWWICKHGHEWQGTIGTRVHNSTGCPKCSHQTSRIEIAVYAEIKALFSNVSWREKIETYECDIFLPDKKIGIEIDSVYWHKSKSNIDHVKNALFEEKGIQLFRLREEGLILLSKRDISFKWSNNLFSIISNLIYQIIQFANLSDIECEKLQQYINEGSLINGKLYREMVSHLPSPPYELSLATKRPDLAKQWAYDLNAPLSPEHFKPGANKNVWWRCEEGHTWKTSINNRSNQNTGCPSCPSILPNRATNEWNLTKIHPQLATEWHHEKNETLRPEEITPNSNVKFWWKCCVGHEWQATGSSRARGSGCPFCYGRYASQTNNLATLYPEILSEWDYELKPDLPPKSCNSPI